MGDRVHAGDPRVGGAARDAGRGRFRWHQPALCRFMRLDVVQWYLADQEAPDA
jgi:hypothetical protein